MVQMTFALGIRTILAEDRSRTPVEWHRPKAHSRCESRVFFFWLEKHNQVSKEDEKHGIYHICYKKRGHFCEDQRESSFFVVVFPDLIEENDFRPFKKQLEKPLFFFNAPRWN